MKNYQKLFPQKLIFMIIRTKSAFTCNRVEISSRDETRPRMKKFMFTREFHPGMKGVEFHSG